MTTIYQMTHQKQNVETQVAEITLNANDLKYEKLLSKILPSNITAPFAFETIGHIIHLNFKDEILPYKYLIAEYLLKKHKNIRTVVNKVNKITSMFRECPFELLAGEPVNEDGRELIKKSEFKRRKYCEDQVVYYIMNLPKTAMEFLDSFTGAEKRF
uniref:tRNA (Guanine(37)-N1)-methyltransferase-like n=1 Tax=Dermatophagoides pteronyssinus TaxID=6956 RepID=A0A6P6XLK2_DERPT|nr:tRNA (guanine(37)-N1)-methyltransferase-like [Dermatophagoides pteronyssinus]